MSRQLIKGCARHLFRDIKMKKLFITALFALLMGGFAATANAQVKIPTGTPQAQTNNKRPKVTNKTDEGSIEAQKNAAKIAAEKAKAEAEAAQAAAAAAKAEKADAEAKQAEAAALNAEAALIDGSIQAFSAKVKQCQAEYNKKGDEKNQFSKYLSEALDLRTAARVYESKWNEKQKNDFNKANTDLELLITK